MDFIVSSAKRVNGSRTVTMFCLEPRGELRVSGINSIMVVRMK